MRTLESTQTYYVYILLCKNNAYYTGYTNDIRRRYQEHCRGTYKCKYTRSFKPVAIAHVWCIVNNKSMAMKIERYIKSMNQTKKSQIIANPELLTRKFKDCYSYRLSGG